MLYYDRIDISEGTDVNKTNASKEFDICRCWYFLNYSFKFQQNVCNRCHDLLMMSINLSNIAILKIKDSYHHCIISIISKNEATKLLGNADLTEKKLNIINLKNTKRFESIKSGDIEMLKQKFHQHKGKKISY